MKPKEPDLEEIGLRLKWVRKNLSMLQKELAKHLNVSPATLSEIEAGNVRPGFDVLFYLTEKYAVNPYYLITGKGTMFITGENNDPVPLSTNSEYNKFLQEFFHYFHDSRVVRSSMMVAFRTYLLGNAEIIKKDMEEVKKERLRGSEE